MHLRVVFSQFVRDMRANRQRTALTLFGLAWGTFCVLVLLSFGEGLHRKQGERMAGLGDKLILIWGGRTSLPWQGFPRGRWIGLHDEDADFLHRDVPGIAAITPEYSTGALLQGPAGQSNAGVAGVRPVFADLRNLSPEPGGRFLNERDEFERRRVVYLGHQVKQDLFGSQEAVGQMIELRGVPFLVVGVNPKKDQDSNYNGPDDSKVFIPAAAAQASLGLLRPDNLVVGVEADADSKEVMRAITAAMGRRHGFDPTDQEVLSSWDVGDMVATFGKVFLGFKIFLAVLGSFTLAVAGIGVSNIMSMAVEDRTSQIGISMALGARRSWLLGQILLETLLVVVAGGTLGVLGATGAVFIGRLAPLENSIGDPVLSLPIAALVAGLLGLLGLISGLGPARRAAYLNPAVALRN